MKYADSGPRSAEILRLILPNIAKHSGNYVPTSYSVWYEHLSGTNADLTRDLKLLLEKSTTLEQSVVEDLYGEHIASRETLRTQRLQKGLQALVQHLASATADSSNSTEMYARSLDACMSELQSLSGADGLQAVLMKLVESTRHARQSVESLRTELKSSQDELQSLQQRLQALEAEALKDPLTGLYNRRGLDQALQRLRTDGLELSRSSLLMIDLDHFKRINDSYGHLFGDQVLCAVAKMLESMIKGRDMAARMGGEEFVVLLPETPPSGAVALAEQFRTAFSRAKVRRAGSDKVIDQLTVSIGVASPDPQETLERAMERADAALYRAKSEGRNCVRVAAPP